LLLPLDEFGLTGEPTAADAVRAGAAVVTMSGDKLLGGPQAGIVVGRREALERMRKNPLTRSFRVDKLTLAALEATLALYRDPPRALREIPTLAQITLDVASLRERAEHVRRAAMPVRCEIVESVASVGGGAFPTARIASVAVALADRNGALEQRLRTAEPAIVGRVSDGRLLLDLRTVFPEDDALLAARLAASA
jgi:L-seryl-tRNA(Ser) seleniumtransferase